MPKGTSSTTRQSVIKNPDQLTLVIKDMVHQKPTHCVCRIHAMCRISNILLSISFMRACLIH